MEKVSNTKEVKSHVVLPFPCFSELHLTDLHNNHFEPNDARKFGEN